jgi:hypothetical protein
MAARPEARLCYPGAVLVWEKGYDEGQGHGFDDADTSAAISRWRKTETAAETILSWYAEQLSGLGWVHGGSSDDGIMHTYLRGTDADPNRETFSVIIRGPGPGMWAPPGGFDGSATYYEIFYRQGSNQPRGAFG